MRNYKGRDSPDREKCKNLPKAYKAGSPVLQSIFPDLQYKEPAKRAFEALSIGEDKERA